MKCVGLISLGATNGIGGVVCQSSARIIPDCLIFVAWKMYCLLIICLLTLEHDGAEMSHSCSGVESFLHQISSELSTSANWAENVWR
jgi:hypothetical protein